MQKYATHELVKVHPDGVCTFGATEPILTVLDVLGFPRRDMFLIGINENCGKLVLDSKDRAEAAQAVLEPAYATTMEPFGDGDWAVDYDRRNFDGSERDWFITKITMKDGSVVKRDGRCVE